MVFQYQANFVNDTLTAALTEKRHKLKIFEATILKCKIHLILCTVVPFYQRHYIIYRLFLAWTRPLL